MSQRLATLKAQRDALDAEIKLVENGIERAAYEGHLNSQLLQINESRKAEGKRPLSRAEWHAGCTTD